MAVMNNYNLRVLNENIDKVILKLTDCTNVEIRHILRKNGLIQVKAKNLDSIASIGEIVHIEKDTKFYISHIAII